MANNITKDMARRELARRELARRDSVRTDFRAPFTDAPQPAVTTGVDVPKSLTTGPTIGVDPDAPPSPIGEAFRHGGRSALSGFLMRAANIMPPGSPGAAGAPGLRMLSREVAPEDELRGILPKLAAGATQFAADLPQIAALSAAGGPMVGLPLFAASGVDPDQPGALGRLATESGKAALLGAALKPLSALPLAGRATGGAGIFGGMTVAEGAEGEDVIAQGLLGAALGTMGKRRKGVKIEDKILQMRKRDTSTESRILSSVRGGIRERMEKVAPVDKGTKEKGQRAELRRDLPKTRKIEKGVLPELRGRKQPDAPPQLPKTPEGKVVMPKVPQRRAQEPISVKRETLGPEITLKMKRKLERAKVVPKAKPTELGALGAPETFRALRETTRKATDKLVQGVKAPPGIGRGVKAAKDVMTQHDRQIRFAESTHQLLKKSYNEMISDPVSQKKVLNAVNQPGNRKLHRDLTPQEKGAATWMTEELNKQREFNRKYQIVPEVELPEGVRYIKGWYKDPKTGKAYTGKYGKFSKSLPEAHTKKYPTYEAAEKAGLKPATYNLGDIIGEGWESLTRAHSAREMIKRIGKIQAEEGVSLVRSTAGKPKPIRMVEDWGRLEKQGLEKDYTRASELGPEVKRVLERKMPVKMADDKTMFVGRDVGIHKSIADHVQAYVENPTYGKLSELNFLSKSLKLGVSVFHPMMLGWQEAANFRIPFKNIPRGLKVRKEMGPELRLLHQEGLELWKGYEDVGYRNQFFEGVNLRGKVGNVITKPVTLMRDFIFNVVQPGMKTAFAFDMLHRNLPKYLKGTGLTKEQVLADFAAGRPVHPKALEAARAVVKKADGHFSGEHYKRSLLETNRMMNRLYFSPKARKFWQGALISPTWQREHLLVAKDVAKSLVPNKLLRKMGLEEMGPIHRDYQRYALGAVMIVGGVDAYNYMMTERMDGKGKHLWQNPESYGFAVRAPWNSVEGNPVYFRPLKSLFEVAEFTTSPIKKVSYKMAPWIGGIASIFWPNYYQREVKGVEDVPAKVGELMEQLAMPISVSQWREWMKGDKTLESAAANTFGFPTRIYKGDRRGKKPLKPREPLKPRK